jgi:hypothetical protein
MHNPLFDEFHKRTPFHVPISTIEPGTYALILSMNFHTAILVEVTEITSLTVSGVILWPDYEHAIVPQWFSRDSKTPALPVDGDLFKQLRELGEKAEKAAAEVYKKPSA